MSRQRKLNDKPVNIVILIDLVDVLHEPLFADGVRKAHRGIMKSYFLAGPDLMINIRLTCTVVTHQDDGEVWNFFILPFTLRNFQRYLLLNLSRNFLSVNKRVRCLQGFRHCYSYL